MSKSGKIWGETEEIYRNSQVSVNFLKIKKGGYCSIHSHKYKSNAFFVLSGKLQITIWIDGEMKDETVLREGEGTDIKPGVFHQFKALTDVTCIETYEARLREPDIERKSQGGMDTAQELGEINA